MFNDESIKNYLPSNFAPSDRDVVCARGKEAYLHPGNKRYRDIIVNNLSRYTGADNKNEKSTIVMTIVEEVRTDAPAGFVRYCDQEQLWYEIGDEASREKVGQTIRESLTQRDPAKRAKKRIKRAINKAKRVAAMEALELEPLPVEQAIHVNLPSMSQQWSMALFPLPPVSSQSAPANFLREPQTAPPQHPQLRASLSTASQFRYPQQQQGERVIPEPLPFASLRASTPADVRFKPGAIPPPFPPPAPVGAATTSSTGIMFQGECIPPPPPPLRPMTSKNLLETLASIPPSLNAMAFREWCTDEQGRFQMQQDADFDDDFEQLFDGRRADRTLFSLSAITTV